MHGRRLIRTGGASGVNRRVCESRSPRVDPLAVPGRDEADSAAMPAPLPDPDDDAGDAPTAPPAQPEAAAAPDPLDTELPTFLRRTVAAR